MNAINTNKPNQPPWHQFSTQATIEKLHSDSEFGLSQNAVAQALQQYGPNSITKKVAQSSWIRLLAQFNQPLIYILLIASLVTASLGEWLDTTVIMAVVLINAAVGFIQESKALKALDALAKSLQTKARTIRGGKTREIDAALLVPGDIVLLQSGDKVPADLRLLRNHDLRVDESVLTGESVAVDKKMCSLDADTFLADRINMAYASTLVTYGQAKGLVIATGNNTEIGQISALIGAAKSLETPLTKKIRRFSHFLVFIILGLAAIAFVAGLLQQQPLVETFMAAVALAVAAIPEGLPAAFTIILAIGVSRMAKRHAIIRKLPAVETLGSTTVVCSDKTGTLTQNQMTVTQIYAGNTCYKLSGGGYKPEGQFSRCHDHLVVNPNHQQTQALADCLLAGMLCNDSILIDEKDDWRVEGDPTEGALLVSAKKFGYSEEHYNIAAPRLWHIPFESQHQFMATLHEFKDKPRKVIYLKGAVETILERCNSQLNNDGSLQALDSEEIQKNISEMSAEGLRVLAFAKLTWHHRENEFTHKDVHAELCFIGLQGMIDPPRTEAINAVSACRTAGIRVVMITGDHAGTAYAIAKKMHIVEEDSRLEDAVLTGKMLAQLSIDELKTSISRIRIFARVSPEQKLSLVEVLQANGQIVAMTGDGVNDAPALKQANIGIAMGKDGTEVAKEAADMVLADDNFATIGSAIEEGRCVYDNLTKFIVWTLPTNMGEALVIIAALFSGQILPVLPVHILWINMTTAIFLGLMLAFEHKEPGLMQRPPRDPSLSILSASLIWRVCLVSILMTIATYALFYLELQNGNNIDKARTIAVNTIVIIEIFYLWNCRSLDKSIFHIGLFSNVWLILGCMVMLGLQLLFTYSEIGNKIFQTAPLQASDWVKIFASGFIVYLIAAIDKFFAQKHTRLSHS